MSYIDEDHKFDAENAHGWTPRPLKTDTSCSWCAVPLEGETECFKCAVDNPSLDDIDPLIVPSCEDCYVTLTLQEIQDYRWNSNGADPTGFPVICNRC